MPKEALNNPEVGIEPMVEFLSYLGTERCLVATHTMPFSDQSPEELVKEGMHQFTNTFVAICIFNEVTVSGALNGQDFKFGPTKQVISTIYPDGKVYDDIQSGTVPPDLSAVDVSYFRKRGAEKLVLMRNGVLQPFGPTDKVIPSKQVASPAA